MKSFFPVTLHPSAWKAPPLTTPPEEPRSESSRITCWAAAAAVSDPRAGGRLDFRGALKLDAVLVRDCEPVSVAKHRLAVDEQRDLLRPELDRPALAHRRRGRTLHLLHVFFFHDDAVLAVAETDGC